MSFGIHEFSPRWDLPCLYGVFDGLNPVLNQCAIMPDAGVFGRCISKISGIKAANRMAIRPKISLNDIMAACRCTISKSYQRGLGELFAWRKSVPLSERGRGSQGDPDTVSDWPISKVERFGEEEVSEEKSPTAENRTPFRYPPEQRTFPWDR